MACATSSDGAAFGAPPPRISNKVARTTLPMPSIDAAKAVPAESMTSMRSPSCRRSTRSILRASLPPISTMLPAACPPSTKKRRAALNSLRTERVLHTFEESAVFDFVAPVHRIFLEQLPLAFIQLRGNHHVYGDVVIAALGTAYAGHTIAA